MIHSLSAMKHLLTLVLVAFSLNAFSQGIPQLPYNPDENGDGVIGVPDLQGLLSQYGLAFNTAILSDDGENAVVNLGDMSYPECAASCRNLPGFWSVATIEDLGLVWNTVNSNTWLKREKGAVSTSYMYFYNTLPYDIASQYISSAKCYCAAHEMQKVEYTTCDASSTANGAPNMSQIQPCINDKLALGWYPLGPPQSIGGNGTALTQAFWRWAE